MENEGRESYEILLAVCKADHLQLTIGYKQMRDLLERLCRLHMHNGSLQMTDLSARISFVAAKVGLSVAEQNRLHTFRLTSNAILNRQQEPTREHLLRDAKTLAFFIRKLLRKIFHRNCIVCFLDGCNLYRSSSSTQAGAADARLFPVFRRAVSVCDSFG